MDRNFLIALMVASKQKTGFDGKPPAYPVPNGLATNNFERAVQMWDQFLQSKGY